jgi:hypothetical protein
MRFTRLRFGVNMMWSTLKVSVRRCRLRRPVSVNQLWLKVTASERILYFCVSTYAWKKLSLPPETGRMQSYGLPLPSSLKRASFAARSRSRCSQSMCIFSSELLQPLQIPRASNWMPSAVSGMQQRTQ